MSNEIYQKNLAILKDRFPEVYRQVLHDSNDLPFSVESFKTASSQTNAIATRSDGKRIALYESEDIIQYTEKLMADWQLDTQDILFCMGMGLGYYPLIAANKFKAHPQIVVIEPYLGIFELAVKLIDLRPLLIYPSLSLHVGESCRINDVIDNFQFRIFLGKQRVVTHTPSRIICGKRFIGLENDLTDGIALTKDLWNTSKASGRDMLSNIISNLPSLFKGVPLGKMRGALAGFPALCISAGPSLDEAVPAIKELQDRVLIVAMDSAVSTLIHASIVPHMVVTCDTRSVNFEKIRPYLEHLRNAILVFGLESNPDNVRAFLGPNRLAVGSDNIFVTNWLAPAFAIDCNLPIVTNVSHTAIYTMMALGANPIVVVGMDMAFPGDKSHAKNSVNRYAISSSKIIEVQGTNGFTVRTYRPMVNYTRQLEGTIANSSLRLVNTCKSGMLIQGMENKSLKEVVETDLETAPNITQHLASLRWKCLHKLTDILMALLSKRTELETYQDKCRIGINEVDRIINRLRRDESMGDIDASIEKLNSFHKQHLKDNSGLIQLLFCIRLDTLKSLEIRRLKLNHKSECGCDDVKKEDELQIIKDDFVSQLEAATFFSRLVSKQTEFYQNIIRIKNRIDRKPTDISIQLQLAKQYSEAGEIWLAENAYKEVIKIVPEDISVQLELVRIFINQQLWGPAGALIQNICKTFPDDPNAKAVKDEIDEKTNKIMERVKEAWTMGDIVTSHRMLNEYLLLCPQDMQAEQFKEDLLNQDVKVASSLPRLNASESTEKQFNDLLTKAGKCIEHLKFEQAVGIIEGLTMRFPAKAAVLRERVGDIRMLQKDYPSALWNYGQVLKMAPQATDIYAKIEDARQLEISP